jgi:Lsr2
MRITIDTREDSYEDALGVLRRAYGRHRMARKTGESPAVGEAVDMSDGGAVSEESGKRSAAGAGRKDAGVGKSSAKGTRGSSGGTSATRAAIEGPPVSKSTSRKAADKSAAASAPSDQRRRGASWKRATSDGAAKTAPRGQSQRVRAWAQAQGLQVRAKGRMPATVIAAYREAHKE